LVEEGGAVEFHGAAFLVVGKPKDAQKGGTIVHNSMRIYLSAEQPIKLAFFHQISYYCEQPPGVLKSTL
jgi:hypothetical protein